MLLPLTCLLVPHAKYSFTRLDYIIFSKFYVCWFFLPKVFFFYLTTFLWMFSFNTYKCRCISERTWSCLTLWMPWWIITNTMMLIWLQKFIYSILSDFAKLLTLHQAGVFCERCWKSWTFSHLIRVKVHRSKSMKSLSILQPNCIN